MPQQWKYVIIMILRKKKDRTECGNYREGYLAGSARRQDTAEGRRSPPQRVLRARGDPVGGTEWFPAEPFYHR